MSKPIDSMPVYGGQVRLIRISGLPNFRLSFVFDRDVFIDKGVALNIDLPTFTIKGLDLEPDLAVIELVDKRELPSILDTDLGEFR